MRRSLMILAGGLLLVAVSVQAQDSKSTTRIERQHKFTHFQKEKMKQSEASILAAIQSQTVGMQQTAIQTLRELEQLAPTYPFSSLIAPLTGTLKSEQTDPVVRRLAALALDELHSEAGDAAIKSVAERSDDTGLQTLCKALLVRSSME
jgi:hypothetical protein